MALVLNIKSNEFHTLREGVVIKNAGLKTVELVIYTTDEIKAKNINTQPTKKVTPNEPTSK